MSAQIPTAGPHSCPDYKQYLYNVTYRPGLYATGCKCVICAVWLQQGGGGGLLPVESEPLLTLKPRRIPWQQLHGAPFPRTWRAGCPGSGRCWATAERPSAWSAPPLSGPPRCPTLMGPEERERVTSDTRASEPRVDKQQQHQDIYYEFLSYVHREACECLEYVALVRDYRSQGVKILQHKSSHI